jgi:hypothetical protein
VISGWVGTAPGTTTLFIPARSRALNGLGIQCRPVPGALVSIPYDPSTEPGYEPRYYYPYATEGQLRDGDVLSPSTWLRFIVRSAVIGVGLGVVGGWIGARRSARERWPRAKALKPRRR